MKKLFYLVLFSIGIILLFSDLPDKSYKGEILVLAVLKVVGIVFLYVFYRNRYLFYKQNKNAGITH